MTDKEEIYEMFYNYYDVFGMQKESTLIAYKFYDKTKSCRTPNEIWKDFKYNYKEQWLQAKEDYFENLGVTEESIILRVNDISKNARSPMTQLEACKFLYQVLTTTKDQDVSNKAQKIIIEYQKSSYVDVENTDTTKEE